MSILFLLMSMAQAQEHSPPYPRGTRTACFEIVDDDGSNPYVTRATVIDGFTHDLVVPDGKYILREIPCGQ